MHLASLNLSPRYGALRAMRNMSLALVFSAMPSLAAEDVTVLALGDSLTAGYGLPEGEGFVPQLQQWLRDHGQAVEVVNAGVSGDTTAGGLARLGWSLTPEVDAMIVNLGGNDMLRGLDPGLSRSNLEAILKEARARELPVLLVGLAAPGNYGPDYKRDFDAIFPDLARSYEADLEANFFAPLTARLDEPDARQRYMQPDGIHPSTEGVAVIVEEIGPRVQALVERARN
ncbi:arylesterase [Cereibacter azotoformans]|uniref:arylesterase n=1 Tax=Cereibacter azotoformans TaxID=43057 RepID=UPI001EEBC206|nr:arylesterase [Cereibacter azotoformans]ULB11464.1 arylesterase [Cereibacter azotoformans]